MNAIERIIRLGSCKRLVAELVRDLPVLAAMSSASTLVHQLKLAVGKTGTEIAALSIRPFHFNPPRHPMKRSTFRKPVAPHALPGIVSGGPAPLFTEIVNGSPFRG